MGLTRESAVSSPEGRDGTESEREARRAQDDLIQLEEDEGEDVNLQGSRVWSPCDMMLKSENLGKEEVVGGGRRRWWRRSRQRREELFSTQRQDAEALSLLVFSL